MNDDMLSQEEINELLKGVSSSEDEDSSQPSSNSELNISDYISEVERDALGEIGNISFGSASTALSTLLNQKVDITTPTLIVISREDLQQEFPKPHVAIHVDYTEGFEGMNLFVMKTSDAAIIADLMLGGDGTNPDEELNEMHTSAVQEAMNQMMGSASTSMSTIFNKRVDISPPSIDLMDVKNGRGTSHVPDEDILIQISFRLTVGNLIDSKIMQLVTISFAKDLVNELMNPNVPAAVTNSEDENKQIPPPQTNPQHVESSTHETSTNSRGEAEPQIQGNFPNRTQQHLGSQFHQRDVDVQPAAFSQFEDPQLSHEESNNLNMLLDIPLEVTVELGRTNRSIKEILGFSQGSIIELDKLAGEPVDILVNRKLIAKGEVVVIDENFGVRVTDIVSKKQDLIN